MRTLNENHKFEQNKKSQISNGLIRSQTDFIGSKHFDISALSSEFRSIY